MARIANAQPAAAPAVASSGKAAMDVGFLPAIGAFAGWVMCSTCFAVGRFQRPCQQCPFDRCANAFAHSVHCAAPPVPFTLRHNRHFAAHENSSCLSVGELAFDRGPYLRKRARCRGFGSKGSNRLAFHGALFHCAGQRHHRPLRMSAARFAVE